MPEIQYRYDFANGWLIIVDHVKDGQVYFQRWPPGIDASFVANRIRMPVDEFLAAINKQREAEATHA